MATKSPTFTSAEALQDYVLDQRLTLLSKAFYGFDTEPYLTVHEGVKGKKRLTELILGDLVRRWASDFAPVAGTVDFNPREIETTQAKVDLNFVPQDFESSYLGEARRQGQAFDDLPFEAYIMDRVMAKVNQEVEAAIWGAADNGGSTATDKLEVLFDGFLEIISDAITATDITAVATPGGSLTESNIIGLVEDMHDRLGASYELMDTFLFCSPAVYKLYNRAYRNAHGYAFGNQQDGRMKLDFAPCYLVPVRGLTGSNRLVLTAGNNLHYAIDSPNDMSMTVVQDHRELHFMMDFRIGCQFGILHDDLVVVNDLT